MKRNVLVIGSGIIGLSVAYHLAEQGHQPTIVDRDPEGDRASFGNAGGIAVTEVIPASSPGVFMKIPGWLMDPLGPLSLRWSHAVALLPWLWRFSKVSNASEMRRIAAALAALNERVYGDLEPMLEACGLSGDLHRKGALSLYETEAAFEADASEWNLKRHHAITCEVMSGDAARNLEPALGSIVKRAVFTPQWSYVSDPRRIHAGVLKTLRQRGVQVLRGTATRVAPQQSGVRIEFSDRDPITTDDVVIAAGAWSKPLAASVGDRVCLESERGYNTTIPTPGIQVEHQIVFAERKFVATPLTCGLRIGGAVELGGLDSAPNHERSEALVKLARRYFPDLSGTGTQWSGHRPCTPDSLPVIGQSPRSDRIFYAFGHGHLGLTQSAPTGKLIADLITRTKPSIDLTPFSISRF